MDQQPKIPTLKDAQKPQVKIKGMGAGLTLFDRLKQFKKKDLAFILAGLGTLFMAPLAEHFMMAPEAASDMAPGFRGGGSGSGSNMFGSGSSPYENGNNSIAQGGAIGGGGDIITPLNVRDPSALVMGPGQAQQPPAGSAAPAVAPPTAPVKSETDYKDALAGAASRAASAAIKRAPLPIPKVALGGSGLRGLGVAGGSSSASGGLLPVGPAAGSNNTGGGSSLNLVRSNPNFKGAVGPRGNAPTGLDNTKKAAANAGDAFSRTGSALSGLNAAASEQIPTGGAGFNGGGQGGAGANDKAPGGSGAGGSKSVGESLAFIEAKERMEENLKLEFEKKRLKDPELLLYGIRNDSLKAMAAEMTKSLTKGILGFMDPSSASTSIVCDGQTVTKSAADGAACTGSDGKGGLGTSDNCYTKGGDGSYIWHPTGRPAVTCTGAKGDASGTSATEQAASDAAKGIVSVPAGATPGSLNSFCSKAKATDIPALDDQMKPKSGVAPTGSSLQTILDKKNQLIAAQGTVGNVMAAQDVLSGTGKGSPSNDCGSVSAQFTVTSPALSVKANIEAMRTAIGGADGKGGLVQTLKGGLSPTDPSKFDGAKPDVDKVVTQWTQTDKLLTDAAKALQDNAVLTLSKFETNAVKPDMDKFNQSYGDTKALADTLRKAVDNLKPAVDGLKAAGSSSADYSAGTARYIAAESKKYDAAIEKAKKAQVAPTPPDPNDPEKKVPLMTDGEVIALPAGTSKISPPATGATPGADIYVTGSKTAADTAKPSEALLTTAMSNLDGTDDQKKSAKADLLKTSDGSMIKNIADGIKTQNDVLDGIGATSDSSTKAPAAATTK